MLNILKKTLFLFSVLLIFWICFGANAISNKLTVVYPKNNATINANSTFFVGNTNPNSILTINDEPVKVYANGSFVKVFPLNTGGNKIELKSILNNEIKTEVFNITVPTATSKSQSIPPEFIKEHAFVVVKEDEAPIRETPYGNRLTPAKKGMFIETIGYINNHYKIKFQNSKTAYILKDSVEVSDKEKIQKQILNDISFFEDRKNLFIKIKMEQPVLISAYNKQNMLNFALDGVDIHFPANNIKLPYIKEIKFNSDNINIAYDTNNIYGFDYYYEDDFLVIKLHKPFTAGFRDKVIAIDPGHGGKECGSIGPTEVPEKDINLNISMYLKKELEKDGATVVMTREHDNFVDLYDRVKIAKKEHADVLISIHNNALPDGQNPYITHGTSTYYYQPFARDLAQNVQNELLKKTRFNNLGIKTGSFVLTRPFYPVSILVETGFMINPFEYEQLLKSDNQRFYAQGIKAGLAEYFKKH